MSSSGRSSRSTSRAGLGQLGGDLERDDADAVLVGVDQVAGADLDAREL